MAQSCRFGCALCIYCSCVEVLLCPSGHCNAISTYLLAGTRPATDGLCDDPFLCQTVFGPDHSKVPTTFIPTNHSYLRTSQGARSMQRRIGNALAFLRRFLAFLPRAATGRATLLLCRLVSLPAGFRVHGVDLS